MGKIAFVFAGQGAQHPGMGRELYELSSAARAVFDRGEALRPGTLAQCFEGPKEALSRTVNTQPCLFLTDWACAAAAAEAGVLPDCGAGFSLGEVAACGYFGMMSFEDAFGTVMRRAGLMDACAAARPGAMAAVLRLTAAQVEALCDELPGAYPVNYNCPGQTVVAMERNALAPLSERIAALKGRALPLNVSGGFHSPLMDEASSGLAAHLKEKAIALPRAPLYANLTARPYAGGADALRTLLSEQVHRPVLWQSTVENMIADGVTTFVEVGPGSTLSGLIKKISPESIIHQVADAASLRETAGALAGGYAC